MAMNNQYLPDNISYPVWWAQHHHPPSASVVEVTEEKEHMFEKALTPSDVGKLNRLVIPKQHAEKYFPLGGGSNSGVDSGLLLSFEDESAKFWQFRYSYWNSSQSYVLTKGWSRYVKEKGLDAGDVVVFGRLRAGGNRMFIGCRRKMAAAAAETGYGNDGRGWSPVVRYPTHGSYPSPSTPPYQPDCLHAGAVATSQTTPISGNSKILRLFGVNVECQPDASDDDVSETMSHNDPSVSQSHSHYQQYYSNGYTAHPQSYMDYSESGEANQMRYHQG